MLSRIRYAIIEGWKNRELLRRYLTAAELKLSCIINLSPQALVDRGVKALALDYDGVLASHAEPRPREEVIKWLTGFAQGYAPHKIYILSNRPTLELEQYFKHNFPEIIFVIAKRKKPYPDGLEQILQMSGLEPAQLLLADDRLGTGILATVITGVQGLWITRPYTDFITRPIAEIAFMCLRYLERLACKII